MNVQMALTALQDAGLDGGKGCKEARKLLARDPWPAEIELPQLGGQYVDPAELVAALAVEFVDGRTSAADLPGRVAAIATERLGGQLWHQLHDRVRAVHESKARRQLANDWPTIDKEIRRREDAARKQRRDANRELAAAANRLGYNETWISSRLYAERAGAAEAWDTHGEAETRLRATYALRLTLSEVGIGERPSHDYMQVTGGRLVAAG